MGKVSWPEMGVAPTRLKRLEPLGIAETSDGLADGGHPDGRRIPLGVTEEAAQTLDPWSSPGVRRVDLAIQPVVVERELKVDIVA